MNSRAAQAQRSILSLITVVRYTLKIIIGLGFAYSVSFAQKDFSSSLLKSAQSGESAFTSSFAQKLCPFKAPVGETGLRKQKATKTVRPIYPEESLKNHVTGRVIVQILVDEKGKVPEANVKEAPDKLTGDSVVAAAKQWEFKPPPKIQGRQLCYESTLTFRFEIHDGKARVVDDPVN